MLSAKEWLLLPEKEQRDRAHELSPHECFLLRTSYAYLHFTEEKKKNMSQEEKEAFISPPKKIPNEFEKKIAGMSISERIEYIFSEKKK